MSLRHKINIFTIGLIVLILFLARKDLVEAWHLLGTADLWILALILPIQFLSYYAAGAGIFSYLDVKGDSQKFSKLDQPKMALELNFVNHILPTAGVSGASYMTWRLQKHGIRAGRAALAQVVRLMTSFAAYVVLLLLSIGWVILDGSVNRYAVLTSVSIVMLLVVAFFLAIFIIGSKRRLTKFANWLDVFVNQKVRRLFRIKKTQLIDPEKVHATLEDLHTDFAEIVKKPQQLLKPFLWGIVFSLAEVAMLFVTFLSLGHFVNPATILVALGLAGIAGILVATPGGAGAYEIAMVFYLSHMGVNAAVATAGVVLARAILVLLTILTGYYFYHKAIAKYGKPADSR